MADTSFNKFQKLTKEYLYYHRNGKIPEALNSLDKIINAFGSSKNAMMQKQVAMAFYSKGLILIRIGEPEKTTTCYNKLINKFRDSDSPEIQQRVAMALFHKGFALELLNKPKEAIIKYSDFIKKFQNSANPKLYETVAIALDINARLLVLQGRYEKALTAYNKLIKKFQNSDNLQIKELSIRGVMLKAGVLALMKKTEKAIIIYEKFLSKYTDSKNPRIQDTVTEVEFCIGILFGKLREWSKSMEHFKHYLTINKLPWNDYFKDLSLDYKSHSQLLEKLIIIFRESYYKTQEASINKPSKNHPKKICHFTSIKALYSILGYSFNSQELKREKNNILRAYNSIYMNDPSEGQALIEYSHQNTSNEIPDLTVFFKDGEYNWVDHETAKSIYSISFTAENDSLTLWRAYGRDGHGIAIVLPIESFEQTNSSIIVEDYWKSQDLALPKQEIAEINSIEKNIKKQVKDDSNIKKNRSKNISYNMPENLYQVQYINLRGNNTDKAEEHDNDFAKNFLKSLKEPISTIENIKKNLEKYIIEYEKKPDGRKIHKYKKNKETIEVINQATREALAGILYLFKDSQYATEKEYRMLTLRQIGDKSICMDEQTPPCLYLKTRPFVFEDEETEIIIGPAVENPERIGLSVKHILSNQEFFNKSIKVKYSEVKYRSNKN